MSRKKTAGAEPGRSVAEKARMSVKGNASAQGAVPAAEDSARTAGEPAREKTSPAKDTAARPEFDETGGIEVELRLGKWDLYQFLMYHSYVSVSGVLSVCLSLFCLIQGISEIASGRTTQVTALVLFVGLWFTVISPIVMIFRASSQMRRVPSLQKPITYVFTEKGMLQKQGDVRTSCVWKQITKAVFMKRIWILYAGKVRGNVLPAAQLGEHKEELEKLIRRHTGKYSTY